MNRTGYKKAMVFIAVVMFLGSPVFAGGGGRGRMRGYGLGPGAYGGPGEDSFRSPMAYGRGPMAGQSRGPGIAGALRRLNLTEEQRESVKNILESARETAETERKAIADAREALHKAVTEGADETAIREAATNLGKVIGDQAVSRAATMTSIKKVLTEEQLEKLQKMKESESRDDLGRAEVPGRGLRRGNQRGMSGRDPGGPGRGAGRFGRGPERGGRGFGEGPGWQGRGFAEGPRVGSRIDRLIEQVDTNNDGTLTAEELEAYKKNVEDQSR